ncbi:MAG: transcription-repair coupling factor [Limisphaerales bacterium]
MAAVKRSSAGKEHPLTLAVETPVAPTLVQRLEQGGLVSIDGVSEPGRAFLISLLHQLLPDRSIVAVVPTQKSQELLHQDVETWLSSVESQPAKPSSPKAAFYPAWDVLPHESRLPHADVISERLETLLKLQHRNPPASHQAPIVLTTVTALQQRTFSPESLAYQTRQLKKGDRCDPMDLIEWLEDQAYEPEAQVSQKGEIALRGGIVDVYPLSSPWPVRLEFFGDDLDSIRYFDPQTQVSRETTDSILLPPAGELGLLRRNLETAGYPAPGSFPQHLPPRSLILLFDLADLSTQARQYAEQAAEAPALYIPWETTLTELQALGHTLIHVELDTLDVLPTPDSPRPDDNRFTLALGSLEPYRPVETSSRDVQITEQQRRSFFDQLHRWLRQDYSVRVFCNNDGEQQRFCEIWNEYGLATSTTRKGPRTEIESTAPPAFRPPPGLQVAIGSLTRGFIFPDARCVVVTDSEIFGRYRVPRPRRLRSPHAVAVKSALQIDFADLEEGDIVVHLQHGIGRYLGLQRLTSRPPDRSGKDRENAGQECLVLEYAPSDPDQPPPKLYVPVTQAHLVSKYVGAGKARPQLNTLGGNRWNKTKAHAEKAVQDLAAELLTIQAARESQAGTPHTPDTPWQREFEGSFLYEETPDQLKAISQTKEDMERPRPMDRLICGDVGFGKTEVAVRAAFKAVMGGKQVAVLVPTTVLAQQHYNTFRERMADYPVRVEMLSRYRSRKQQNQTIQELASGAVDIVIGTHRLVQPDVQFRDLGLVIVDEEQRFGVLHKERFKRLRHLVDVLTLSATPIPRTLHLALTGARDMSTIETPPQDRLPVQTIVTPYDERVIRDAIVRELNRSGQVFFLHNRVTTIHTLAAKLQTLVPQARFVIGHGQMPPDELEEVMTRFINGEADVLLSTTIIESGIDIPNANTIIIDRADRFGLSDLYQLRGRVGRYKHQAYAYFLLPRHASLLADARKRISAIRQYSSLGSGFKIAMRDLEIRGAGNLLGSEQSGHITAVGFELYCQLLKQSVSQLKGEKVQPRIQVEIRLDFIDLNPAGDTPQSSPNAPTPAHLPNAYMPETQHRIEFYRRLAEIQTPATLKALRRELRDRFGPIPPPAELLLIVTEIKTLAAQRNVTIVETKEGRVMLTRNGDFITLGGKFPRLSRKNALGQLNEVKQLLQAI